MTVDHGALTFAGRFVRRPGTVGSIVPSTPQLAAAMVRPLVAANAAMATNRRRREPLTVVELGAGTGAFTNAIVPCLGPGDRFLMIELDPVFCGLLKQRWPAVDTVCASAESLVELLDERGWPAANHIVSGLPFATLPIETTRRIVAAIGETLQPGGTFTTFHYAHSFVVPRASAFRRHVGRVFRAAPSTTFVAWNFPPALAVSWTRPTRPAGR